MKRLFYWVVALTITVGIGVASGALYWFAGPGHQQDTAGAASSVDNTPPVSAPSGRVPLSESGFPLGYGCSSLDFNKVNAIIKTELQARGISETTGPGLVKYCRQDGNQWVLGIMAPVGNGTLGKTIPAPDNCRTPPGAPPSSAPGCQLPADAVSRLVGSQNLIQFEIRAQASEVAQ